MAPCFHPKNLRFRCPFGHQGVMCLGCLLEQDAAPWNVAAETGHLCSSVTDHIEYPGLSILPMEFYLKFKEALDDARKFRRMRDMNKSMREVEPCQKP